MIRLRRHRNVKNNARHNERKLSILIILKKSTKYLTATNIAKLIGITKGNAWRQMTKLAGQGYIWRRKINGTYHYLYLKPMGERVLKALWVRNEMRIMSGDDSIPMNLKKLIPLNYYNYERRAIEECLRKF